MDMKRLLNRYASTGSSDRSRCEPSCFAPDTTPGATMPAGGDRRLTHFGAGNSYGLNSI
jgi:hypothetical protein